jgi:hypothetical protein
MCSKIAVTYLFSAISLRCQYRWTLPVVLYGYGTWSLTLREKHWLRVLVNWVLRRTFGPKSDTVTGEWRRLPNSELHDLYCSHIITWVIKSMRWARHVAGTGEDRNSYRVLESKPQGKRPLAKLRCRWENNIKMDLTDAGCDSVEWIDLAYDRDKWQAGVNTAMNPRVTQNVGNISTGKKLAASQE